MCFRQLGNEKTRHKDTKKRIVNDTSGDKMFDRLVVSATSYQTKFKSRIYRGTLCG